MKQSINIDEPFYCAAPASSLFVDPHGKISACCSGTYYYGNLFNSSSLEDIVFSQSASLLRDNVFKGIPDTYCTGCLRSELISKDSQRQFYRNLDIENPTEFTLKSLDLRWSTVCNFACVYCNEQWSSTWNKIKGLPPIKSQNLKRVNDLLDFIEKYGSNSIEQVLIAGGEPLLQVQNNRLLDILPNNCKIHIITNLGVDLTKSSIFEKLKNRNKVTWSISIENIKSKFEYVRQGGSWDLFEQNIQTIKTLTSHRLFFLSVLNIFSVWDIEEFTSYANQVGIKIAWQTIKDRADSLDPGNFNRKLKNILLEKLELQKNNSIMFNNRNFIPETINYLKRSSKGGGDINFRKFIKEHESKYNITEHTFRELWPDLDRHINNYFI